MVRAGGTHQSMQVLEGRRMERKRGAGFWTVPASPRIDATEGSHRTKGIEPRDMNEWLQPCGNEGHGAGVGAGPHAGNDHHFPLSKADLLDFFLP